MNSKEFAAAFAIANSKADLSAVDDSIMFGYGLPDFQPVTVTLAVVAKTLRWQALQFNGQWNSEELNNCREAFRRRVMIVNATREAIDVEVSALAAELSRAANAGDVNAFRALAYKLDAYGEYAATKAKTAIDSARSKLAAILTN